MPADVILIDATEQTEGRLVLSLDRVMSWYYCHGVACNFVFIVIDIERSLDKRWVRRTGKALKKCGKAMTNGAWKLWRKGCGPSGRPVNVSLALDIKITLARSTSDGGSRLLPLEDNLASPNVARERTVKICGIVQ